MKTIFLIADHTAATENAARQALNIARHLHLNIIVGQTQPVGIKTRELVVVDEVEAMPRPVNGMPEALFIALQQDIGADQVKVEVMDIADYDERQLAAMINQGEIWLVVKGMANGFTADPSLGKFTVEHILNRTRVPVMFIPEQAVVCDFERLVYMADLRYCRCHILRFLTELAKPYQAGVSVAHISAEGLMNMADEYAEQVFKEEVCRQVHYDKLYLNNTHEKDLARALDVLINGMHNDLLALINHRYHFEQILGRHIGELLPPAITIPIIIFPY
jgi:hypothetical protein